MCKSQELMLLITVAVVNAGFMVLAFCLSSLP